MGGVQRCCCWILGLLALEWRAGGAKIRIWLGLVLWLALAVGGLGTSELGWIVANSMGDEGAGVGMGGLGLVAAGCGLWLVALQCSVVGAAAVFQLLELGK